MRETYETGFANVNGAQLYYEIIGSGAPLVLVHAGICDARMWEPQVDALAQYYQVVRYDLRGYGQSAPVDGPFAHHTDLLGLLDYLAIERTAVLGCSMGGTTAIDFALAYPERITALITVCCEPSGFVDPVEEPLPPGWDEYRAAARAGDLDQVNEYELHLWVDGLSRSADQVDPTVREQVRTMNLIALRNEALVLGETVPLDPPAAERLDTIQVPTLVLIGDLDYPSMVRAADQMAATIPHAQQAVISGTAHLPNLEQPEPFNRLVLDFLAQQNQE